MTIDLKKGEVNVARNFRVWEIFSLPRLIHIPTKTRANLMVKAFLTFHSLGKFRIILQSYRAMLYGESV